MFAHPPRVFERKPNCVVDFKHKSKMLSVCVLQSFNTLHMMYHEATACHVTGDLVELLSIFLSVLKASRPYLQRKGQNASLLPHLKIKHKSHTSADACCSLP